MYLLLVSLFFHSVWGDVNTDNCFVAPQIRPNENVTFLLNKWDVEELELPIFNVEKMKIIMPDNLEVKILIHGYKSDSKSDFNVALRQEFLRNKNTYVIYVDWAPLGRNPCRPEASKNARLVGNCTAQLVDILVQDVGIPLLNIHVIGFSMGGQISGFISEFLTTGKLERISALDPTLPFFDTPDKNQRLDRDDAIFVDVIHTAAGIKGQIEPVGHVDFYANGGKNQPGCNDLTPDSEDYMLCSHKRSYAYYNESIHSNFPFYGYTCVDRYCDSYMGHPSAVMGYYASPLQLGQFYVPTAASSPFAVV